MRSHQGDPFDDPETGRVRIHDEGAEALCTGPFASAGEDGVAVGKAAVGDEGLGSVQHPMVAIPARAGRHGGDIRAGIGLGQGEGGDGLARGHARQPARLLLVCAEQADRAGAQTLHGEDEVGQAGATGEGLPGQAQGADVQLAGGVRHGVAEPTALGECLEDGAAVAVEVVVAVQVHRLRPVRPGLQIGGEGAVAVVEEGPVEEGAVRHGQFPSNTGSRLAAKAS